MTFRIKTDLDPSEKLLTQATNQAIGILEQGEALFTTIDGRITTHIENVFKTKGGGKRWAPITEFTKLARKNSLDGTATRLYYARNPRRTRGEFGWTLRMRKRAGEPGKITRRSLLRNFGEPGDIERKKLEWFHFGGVMQVTKKMRNFLHSQGIHLKASTTQLVREPRPIYRVKRLDQIVRGTTQQFLDLVFEGGEVHTIVHGDLE